MWAKFAIIECAIRKGKKLNSADALTDEEIEEFYRAGVLGNKTPWALNSEYSLDEQSYLFRHEAWTGATRYLELKTNADGLRYVH